MACLTDHGVARLAPGDFPIAAEIDMPDGSRLLGDATWPRLFMVATAQSLVRVHNDGEVAFLRLDGLRVLRDGSRRPTQRHSRGHPPRRRP